MCHEGWWNERRARRADEAREIWLEFERTWPEPAPEFPEERPDEIRLDTEEHEPVPVER